MSVEPIITFKAGRCEFDGTKIRADPIPGFLYFHSEDDIMHFCWRPRTAPADQPELELYMVPGDASFTPYTGPKLPPPGSEYLSPSNGRYAILKFSSSSDRHLFWLQSATQHSDGKPNWWSQRDLKLVKVVDLYLQGQEVRFEDIQEPVTFEQGPRGDGDDDEEMDDAEPDLERHESTGGAGPDATGGDFREEGESAREGGADGARAVSSDDPQAVVQRFLDSLKGGSFASGSAGGGGGGAPQRSQQLFTTLSDLLTTEHTIPVLQSADATLIDALLSHLPPTLLVLSQEADNEATLDLTPDAIDAALEALSLEQKKEILARVLRSPQLSQSLTSLTVALRDGGLPSVSEALKVPVENGGLVRGGSVPLGGGDAVEAFVKGVKKQVEDSEKEQEGRMDTS